MCAIRSSHVILNCIAFLAQRMRICPLFTFPLTLPTFLNNIMPKILIKTLSLVSVIETTVYMYTKNIGKKTLHD